MLEPGRQLPLSPEDLETLGNELVAIIDDYERQQQLMLRNINVHWSWYEAKPAVEVRSDPWVGASNIVVPFIRTVSDSTAAKYYNTVTGTGKVWSGRTDNDEFDPYVAPITDFLNNHGRREMGLDAAVGAGVDELCPIGSTHWGLRWVDEHRTIFVPGGKGSKRPGRQKVTLRRGPVLEHIPRERIIYDTNYDADEAPLVARQGFFTYQEMLRMARQGYWDEEAVERARSADILGSGSPTVEVFTQKRERAGAPIEDTPSAYIPHDIREVWVDWPFLTGMNLASLQGLNRGDEDEEPTDDLPIVVTLHMATKVVLRAIAKPYFIRGNPFYSACFRKRPGSNDSPGLAKLAEHIQHGLTTLVNQSIDAVTFANSILGVTNDPKLQNARFNPGKWLYTGDTANVAFPNTGKAIQPDLALMGMLQAMGERVANSSDPQLGRETRMGGHPAPATTTMALLHEGNMLHKKGIQEIRRAITKVGMDTAALFQQFETDEDGRIERAIGKGDARVVREWLFPREAPIYGNLELDLAALSETMNPEAARNAAIMVDQVTTNYYARLLNFIKVGTDPSLPPVLRDAALKGADVIKMSFSKILENADVDDPDKFTFNLAEALAHAEQQLAAVNAANAAQQPGGGPPQPAAGGLPGPSMEPGGGSPAGLPGLNGGAPPAGA